MFCTAHHQPRPAAVKAISPDRRVRVAAQQRRAPGQIYTDFASI